MELGAETRQEKRAAANPNPELSAASQRPRRGSVTARAMCEGDAAGARAAAAVVALRERVLCSRARTQLLGIDREGSRYWALPHWVPRSQKTADESSSKEQRQLSKQERGNGERKHPPVVGTEGGGGEKDEKQEEEDDEEKEKGDDDDDDTDDEKEEAEDSAVTWSYNLLVERTSGEWGRVPNLEALRAALRRSTLHAEAQLLSHLPSSESEAPTRRPCFPGRPAKAPRLTHQPTLAESFWDEASSKLASSVQLQGATTSDRWPASVVWSQQIGRGSSPMQLFYSCC